MTSIWGILIGALIALLGSISAQLVAGRWARKNLRETREAERHERQIAAAGGFVVAARSHRRAARLLAGKIDRNKEPSLFAQLLEAEGKAKDELHKAVSEARTRVFDRDLLILINKANEAALDHTGRFFELEEPSDQDERLLENALIKVENRCQVLASGHRCLQAETPLHPIDEK